MANSEKDHFSFTWQIENFSMCSHLFKECMFSPKFELYGTKWKLRMYPRGYQEESFMSCFLERVITNTQEETSIEVDYELTAHSGNPEEDIRHKAKKRFECGSCISGSNHICRRQDILNTMNVFLQKDILTIYCRMRRKDFNQNISRPPDPVSADLYLAFPSLGKEMITTALRDESLDFQTQFASSHYLGRTHVRVGRKSIMWPIRRVAALRLDQRLSIPVVTTGADAPTLAMTLYLSGESVDNQSVQIEIRMKESGLTKRCFVRCRITAVNGSMKDQHFAVDQRFFLPTKKDVWKFPTFLHMKTLMEEKYLDATQGTLNLRCEFAFSIEGEVFHIEESDSVPFASQFPKPVREEFNDVQSMCKKLYEDEKFSDIILRTGARTFKVHKNILSARSSVFRAMFEADMSENNTGIVDINDCEPDTIEQLLAFIYTNRLEDLQPEKAMELYSVADKYEVLSLKWHCSNHMKSSLSISNVCEVLALADMHQDRDLLDHVQKYIQLNSDVILQSQTWKGLMKSNAALTSRVMHDLLTRKMDHS